MLTIKHTKEALAFWTLFKSMKPEIKNEVRDMIIHETSLTADGEFTSDLMTQISLDSFQEIWDSPENEPWDDFIKDRLKCTDREI
jgi:hypothetical protein